MAGYSNSKAYESGSSGGTIDVPDSLRFADTIVRDDYFATNPSKLKTNVYVTVAGQLQRYNGDFFEDTSVVIKGDSGEDAPKMAIQYSATGNSGWQNTVNLSIHKYWRWSTDGGITWSPDFVKFSGDGGSGVPEPYTLIVGNNGKLQLYKDGVLIQEQDETGLWSTNSITTAGSLHLGDLYSIGGGGENVTFLNNDSNIAWYPSWGGASVDGTQTIEMNARVHGVLETAEPVGAADLSGSVFYADTFTAVEDVAFFSIDIIPAETFSGRLRWVANKSTGKEVAAFYLDVDFTEGVETSIQFEHPLWASTGQTFTIQLIKDGGGLVRAKPSTTQPSKPWRRTYYRTYTDHKVFHEGNPADQALVLNALTGADRLSATAIRDFPVMSGSNLGMAKLGVTMSIDEDGVLNTAISPTGIKIVSDEDDRLLIPVSGGAILAIQQDTGFTYGIEADQDTSVVGNWKQIGTVATNVVSFNDRNGAVVPQKGDYKSSMIKVTHDDTGVNGYIGIDNNGIYWDSSFDSLDNNGDLV